MKGSRGNGSKLVHVPFKFSPEPRNSRRPPRQHPSSLSRNGEQSREALVHQTFHRCRNPKISALIQSDMWLLSKGRGNLECAILPPRVPGTDFVSSLHRVELSCPSIRRFQTLRRRVGGGRRGGGGCPASALVFTQVTAGLPGEIAPSAVV